MGDPAGTRSLQAPAWLLCVHWPRVLLLPLLFLLWDSQEPRQSNPAPQCRQPASAKWACPGLAPAILTDSRALVPFGRTMVRTVAKGGTAPLNVASAGLKRPPEGSLMAPLEVLTSSSPFGYRVSPITGTDGDFHLGQDFAAGCGTRVYSADAGVVRAAGWHPWGGGNRVEIDHGNGLITTYNHLEAIAVRAGDTVQVGQVIARVGTTGWSTGCHLHFETILHGKHTSPLNWTLLAIRQVDELAGHRHGQLRRQGRGRVGGAALGHPGRRGQQPHRPGRRRGTGRGAGPWRLTPAHDGAEDAELHRGAVVGRNRKPRGANDIAVNADSIPQPHAVTAPPTSSLHRRRPRRRR